MGALVSPVLVGLLCLLDSSMTKESAPRVQVYSHKPGYAGTPNSLICHVSNFHPPEIKIDLLKNGVVMNGQNQTDLAFGEDWYYHLTKHVTFTPNQGDNFACRVTHMQDTRLYHWESDV